MARFNDILSTEEQKKATEKAVQSALGAFRLELAGKKEENLAECVAKQRAKRALVIAPTPEEDQRAFEEVSRPTVPASAVPSDIALPDNWLTVEEDTIPVPSRKQVLDFIDEKYARIARMLDEQNTGVYNQLFIGARPSHEFIAETQKPPEMAGLSDTQWKSYLREWGYFTREDLAPPRRPAKTSVAAPVALEPVAPEAAPIVPPIVPPAPEPRPVVPPVSEPAPKPPAQPPIKDELGDLTYRDTVAPRVEAPPLRSNSRPRAATPETPPAPRAETTRPESRRDTPPNQRWDDAFELFQKLRKLEKDLALAKQQEERVSRGVRGALYGWFGEDQQVSARIKVSNLEHEDIPRARESYTAALRGVSAQGGKRSPEIEEQ